MQIWKLIWISFKTTFWKVWLKTKNVWNICISGDFFFQSVAVLETGDIFLHYYIINHSQIVYSAEFESKRYSVYNDKKQRTWVSSQKKQTVMNYRSTTLTLSSPSYIKTLMTETLMENSPQKFHCDKIKINPDSRLFPQITPKCKV